MLQWKNPVVGPESGKPWSLHVLKQTIQWGALGLGSSAHCENHEKGKAISGRRTTEGGRWKV